MRKQTIKSLILARKGSERVKNKNTRPFAGSSLLEIKIRQMKRIQEMGHIDGVVINSNDEEALAMGKSLGCEIIKRDDYYCTSEISPNELYVHLAETFPADVAMFTNTTSPLVSDATLIKASKEYFEKLDRYDSLNACHLIKEFLWLDGKPINYDLDNKPRSQDLPDILSLDSATDIIACETMHKCRNFVGKNPNLFIVDSLEGKEVDYPIDFEICEFLYQKQFSQIVAGV